MPAIGSAAPLVGGGVVPGGFPGSVVAPGAATLPGSAGVAAGPSLAPRASGAIVGDSLAPPHAVSEKKSTLATILFMAAQSSPEDRPGESQSDHALSKLVSSPETLAAFRISVAFVLLFSSELHGAVRYAALAPNLRVPPLGLGLFAALAPISVVVAQAMRALAVASAVATMLGLYTRVATKLLLASSFYLLALGQLGGTVVHDMHLVWFAAILAVSPAGDAFSVDMGRARPPPPSTAYGIPVWTARALFAAIYFFPGLHKVMTQGLGWASVENLSLELHWKWFEWNEVPSFRLDLHPRLLAAGGLATLAFELGFPFLLLTRKTRVVAAIFGLAFHLTTDAILRIKFSSLWLCYPVLFDFTLGARDASRAPAPSRASLAALGSLLLAVFAFGVQGVTAAFPFACYPTFAERPPETVPDLRLVAIGRDGVRTEVPHARNASGVRAQSDWGRVWALAGATAPVSVARLEAYVAEVRRARPRAFVGASAVEVARVDYRVSPDARGAPPVHQAVLTTVALAP